MSGENARRTPPTDGVGIAEVMTRLEGLEATVDSSAERQEVRHVRRMRERVPGGEHIYTYTTRDIAEGILGGIVFSLPLLVEDGVFAIAEWFAVIRVGTVPALLLVNFLFIVALISGLLYHTDIRQVHGRLVFGIVPKRLVVILFISLVVAVSSMLLWGRLHVGDPTTLEAIGLGEELG